MYIVIEGNEKSDFINAVNARIKDGFKLKGGVSVVYRASGVEWKYFQAMYKEEVAELPKKKNG